MKPGHYSNEDIVYLLRSPLKNNGKSNKVGYTNKLNTRISQYRTHNPGIEVVNWRRGNGQTETSCIEIFKRIGVKLPGFKEWFNYSKNFEKLFSSMLLPEDIAAKLNSIFLEKLLTIGDLFDPKTIIDKIKIETLKFNYNKSDWDENRCIEILSSVFKKIKEKDFKFLPGKNIDDSLYYSPKTGFFNGFIDLRETRSIVLNFGDGYPTRSITFDLFPILYDTLSINEKESNLGITFDKRQVDIKCEKDFTSLNPYFNRGVSLAISGVGKKINDVIPKKSYYWLDDINGPNLNPFSKKYFPVILDNNDIIIGLDGLSIVTFQVSTQYLKALVADVINILPDNI